MKPKQFLTAVILTAILLTACASPAPAPTTAHIPSQPTPTMSQPQLFLEFALTQISAPDPTMEHIKTEYAPTARALSLMPPCRKGHIKKSAQIKPGGYFEDATGRRWWVYDQVSDQVGILSAAWALRVGLPVEPAGLGVCTTLQSDGSVVFDDRTP